MQRVTIFITLLITTLIIIQKATAQEIQVFSKADNSPLPFATVTNHSKSFVLSSDKNGVAKFTAGIGDTISISYVGYKSLFIQYNGEKLQIISLIQQQNILPAINVRNCKNTKEYNYSNFETNTKLRKKDNLEQSFAGVFWTKGANANPKIAIFLKPPANNTILQDFSFWIEKEGDAPKSSILTPLLISFYEVSSITNLPGKLISSTPIIYYPTKIGKQTVHVDSLRIEIPSNGIYVSLQYVMNEEYEWRKLSKWKKHNEDTITRDTSIIMYGGLISGVRSIGFDLVFYNAIKDEWFSPRKKPAQYDERISTIKCEVTIKYCENEKSG